jgi:hypothetical protein
MALIKPKNVLTGNGKVPRIRDGVKSIRLLHLRSPEEEFAERSMTETKTTSHVGKPEDAMKDLTFAAGSSQSGHGGLLRSGNSVDHGSRGVQRLYPW